MARDALWQVPLRADAPWIHREGVLWPEPSQPDRENPAGWLQGMALAV